MSNIGRQIVLFSGLAFLLSACDAFHQQATVPLHSPQPTVAVNCKALKRQQIYNETNMNTETNNTTFTQRQALQAFIAQHCP